MLIRKVLSETDLVFYKEAFDKNGFVSRVSDAISEFFRYRVSPDSLLVSQNPKLKDLYNIYVNYIEYLKREYISTDEILDFLAAANLDFLSETTVWADGFVSFSKQEQNVLDRLIASAKDVYIAFASDTPANYYDDLKISDLYFESKNAVNKFKNYKTPAPIFLKREKRDVEIEIIKAQNIFGELKNASFKIHYLAREKNYRYNEIALVAPDVNEYKGKIRSAFSEFGIPAFFDAKTDVLSHPLTELIRSLADIAVYNYSYEAVFRFLKTGLTGIERDECDDLENFVLAKGVKGYKWKTNWRGADDRVLEIKNRVLEIIEPINALSKKKEFPIEVFCERIFDVLFKINIDERLKNLIQNERRPDVLRLHKQIWGKIVGVFEKLVEILGKKKTGWFEFGKILDAGLSEIDMGIIPPVCDSVYVGDLKRSRLPEIKALFLIAANDGITPPIISESGILTDDLRAELLAAGIELAPDRARETAAQNFLIEKTLSKPSEYLCVSYSAQTLEGKRLRRFNFKIAEKEDAKKGAKKGAKESVKESVKESAKEIVKEGAKEGAAAKETIFIPEPSIRELGAALYKYSRECEPPNAEIANYLDLYNAVRDTEEAKTIAELISSDVSEQKLSREAVKDIYGAELPISASRIEKFAACPFAYFIEYNLKARKRKIHEIGAPDLGELFHRILEKFTAEMPPDTLKTIKRERIKELVRICVDSIIRENIEENTNKTDAFDAFTEDARLAYAVRKIKRVAERSIWALSLHAKCGDFENYAVEAPINEIKIQINSKTLRVAGRIDRVDVYNDNGTLYAKIIDYKSGAKKFDLDDVYFGTQTQLLLYMDAFIKRAQTDRPSGTPEIAPPDPSRPSGAPENAPVKVLPGGAFYFNLDDPIVDYSPDYEEEILKKFSMSGLVLEDAAKALDKNYPKGFVFKGDAVSLEKFNEILESVNLKIIELGEEILKGNIKVAPFKKGVSTGCDYCEFRSVCQFDIIDKPRKYNYTPRSK
jgi:ATP-dependent helicase/nuclease subunit B